MREQSGGAAEGRLQVQGNRWIGHAEYGDPQGTPIFYFHGFPTCRLEAALADQSARRLGVRLIALDRPGFGRSDFQPGRAIGDWPADVEQIADRLGVQQFSVLGVSGGGPYAAACAWKIPSRLRSAAIVAGLGPLHHANATRGMSWLPRAAVALTQKHPALSQPLYRLIGSLIHRQCMLFGLTGSISPPDRAALACLAVREQLRLAMREAVLLGPSGCAWELKLLSHVWGFNLTDIKMRVHLFHGEQDRVVDSRHGRVQAESIPNCHAQFYPNEGHYSLPINRSDEIFRAILQ